MNIFAPVDALVSAMMGSLSPTGKTWARVGVIVLAVGAAMSFDFGYQVSFKHACFLAGLTFVAAFGPEAAYRAFEMRKFFIGGVAAVGALSMLTIQLGVDQSYTAGIRGKNRDEATVQNIKWDGAQETAKEDKANLELWTAQLAKLVELNAWAPTVKADAMREELATLKARIVEEQAGKRGRRAGCGKECERLQNEANALEQRIGIAEQAAGLTARIEATKRKLDEARTVAAKVEYKSSAVVHANTAIAKAVAFFGRGELKPSQSIEEGTDIATNSAMAWAATTVPAFCFLIAVALYRREDEHTIDIPRPAQPPVTRDLTDDTPPMRVINHKPRIVALSSTTIAALRAAAA